MTIIIPKAITAQAHADPVLRRAFEREIRNEEARIAAHQKAAARYSGVSWSGMGPGPFRERTAAQLLADAKTDVRKQADWEESPYGQFVRAEQRVEKVAEQIANEIAALASGRSRADHAVDDFVMGKTLRIKALVADMSADIAVMELMGAAAMADGSRHRVAS